MHEATLDRWTKQIVSIALRELREANGGLDQEALIGDLSQCVREVIDLYRSAAARCMNAGFDGVEIHAPVRNVHGREHPFNGRTQSLAT